MKGFTFFETLIVLLILGLFLSAGFVFNYSFYQSFLLEGERELLLNLLNKARLEALDNLYGLPRGIYFADNYYLVFSGSNYNSRNPAYDQIYPRAKIKINSPFSEVVFNNSSATSSASGTMEFIQGSKIKKIQINHEGLLEW
jgi:prepilin-type N-terminal cleavage/methylation domain-containing protein